MTELSGSTNIIFFCIPLNSMVSPASDFCWSFRAPYLQRGGNLLRSCVCEHTSTDIHTNTPPVTVYSTLVLITTTILIISSGYRGPSMHSLHLISFVPHIYPLMLWWSGALILSRVRSRQTWLIRQRPDLSYQANSCSDPRC